MDTERLASYFIYDLEWGQGFQSQIVFHFLLEAAEEAKGGVVLDAGAGAQRYKPFFEESFYVAQEHPIAGKENKQLREFDILCDVRQIPLRDASVDVVLSTSSLEHMEYPDEFFAESFRVLKPGGSLYINVPFIYMEHETPYDFQRPTRYGLHRYYEHQGFERVTVHPTSSAISTAQFWFLHAVVSDGQRLDPSLHAEVQGLYSAAKNLCDDAVRLLDHLPTDDTVLPIGWIAKGYKKGKKKAGPTFASKKDFITENAHLDSTMVLKDGHILPK